MDPLTFLLRLPFLPLQGVIKLGELVGDEADRELHDPAAVRHRLEEAEEARRSGDISEQDVAQMEREAVDRLGGRQVPAKPVAATDGQRRPYPALHKNLLYLGHRRWSPRSDRNICEIRTRYPTVWYRNMRRAQCLETEGQTADQTGDVDDSTGQIFIDTGTAQS